MNFKRLALSLVSLLMAVTFLPMEAALAFTPDTSGDTAFRSGEQAYMLQVCGMDGNAFAHKQGAPITPSTNARTAQDWAETLKNGQAEALRGICKETLDNCNELRLLPISDTNDLAAITAVENEIEKYLDTLEPVNSWLDWSVEKLDYHRQRVDYLIRQYNKGGKDDKEKAQIVRDCRNLTAEIVDIVGEMAKNQASAQSILDNLEKAINQAMCSNGGDRSQLSGSTAQLATYSDRVDELVQKMDKRAIEPLQAEEGSKLQDSKGKDFKVKVLSSDQWGAFLYSTNTKQPLKGVKAVVTSIKDKSVSKTYYSNSEGMIILNYKDFKPSGNSAYASIDFSLDGYRLFSVASVQMIGACGVNYYMTKDNGDPYIISATMDHSELLQTKDIFYVTEYNDIDHCISMRVNTKGKSLKVQYYYDDTWKIAETGYIKGDDVKVSMVDKWLNGKKIVAGTKGTRFYLYQGFNNYETYKIPAEYEQSDIKKPVLDKTDAISFSPGAMLGIPKELLGFGKLDFALDLGLPEVSILCDVGNRIFVAIGDKLKDVEDGKDPNKWKSRSWADQSKRVQAAEKEGALAKINAQRGIMAEDYKSKKMKFLGDAAIDFNFSGTGVGRLNDGRASINMGGTLSLTGKVEFTWQFYIPTPWFAIPCFFGLDFSVAMLFYAEFGLEFDFPSFKNFAVSCNTGLTFGITITIGATLGVGHAKIANVYGRIYGTVGAQLFIGKSSYQGKGTIGWGWEIGLQIFLFKVAWKHGPFTKELNISRSGSSKSTIGSYVLSKALMDGSTLEGTLVSDPIDENASAFYPEFNDYMSKLTVGAPQDMNGSGIKPLNKYQVMGDISTVGQEIRYVTVGAELFGLWIMPNVDYNGFSGRPKLVWVNISNPAIWGVVDAKSGCRGDNFDVAFDAFVLHTGGGDRLEIVITSAPVSGYEEKKQGSTVVKKPIYNTKKARLTYLCGTIARSGLVFHNVVDVPDKHRDLNALLESGYMYTAPTVISKNIGNQTHISFTFCMQKVNDGQIDYGPGLIISECISHITSLQYIGESSFGTRASVGWHQIFKIEGTRRRHRILMTTTSSDGKLINLYYDGSGTTGRSYSDTIENVISIAPVYDSEGTLTSALYLKRSASGANRLGSAAFDVGKMRITDYDIEVKADHFKVSPTMKQGNYYIYWVEQSKGVAIGAAFPTEPKYTVRCCVFDATEKQFSPAFTLLETDVEVATADFQFQNNKLYMYCLVPNADSGKDGPLAYVRGKLFGYRFDFKGIVDLLGAGPSSPVVGAGMANKVLVKVTNSGNLPVSKFSINAYYVDDKGAKKLLKEYTIDTTDEQQSQITNYHYDAQGVMTSTSKRNVDHEVYQVPCIGDENDTLFINPTITDIDGDGNIVGNVIKKPRYLKILMPGYTRMYKFGLDVPKEWASKTVKLYVEVNQVATYSPENSLFVSRDANGNLVDGNGAIVPEFELGFDPANGTLVSSATADGLTLTLGKVWATDQNGASVLTSAPNRALLGQYNDLWINVTQRVDNGMEYCTVTIGNNPSDGGTPAEPPTLVVTTDGKETFRYKFAKTLNGNYSYMLDAPTYSFSRSPAYDSLVFTVQNSASYNELDAYDNTCEIYHIRSASPVPHAPPKTGDESNPPLWGAMAGFSLLLILLMIWRRYDFRLNRKKGNEECK